MSASLDGRVALVTGVSRRVGIGAAVTRRLADLGASVFVHSWAPHDAEQPWGADPLGADAVVAGLPVAGSLAADFLDPAAPEGVMAAAVRAHGHVDVLVANHARSSAQNLEQLTSDELDASYAVNTRATLLLVKAFAAQHDDARRGGRVVLFTSGQHRGPMPAELPYIASKGALHQVTRSLAAHLAPRGVTVNCVNPGATDTGYADEAMRAAFAAAHPQGRWGTPDDAARLVGWLATDDARWVTGQVIDSDGGAPYG